MHACFLNVCNQQVIRCIDAHAGEGGLSMTLLKRRPAEAGAAFPAPQGVAEGCRLLKVPLELLITHLVDDPGPPRQLSLSLSC